jgi:hypothetical protein
MRRLLLALAATLTACGSEDVQLTLTVNPVAEFTNQATLEVTGIVARSPAKETVVTVVVSGGISQVTDSLPSAGVFSLSVELHENQENQLAVSAFDDTGATATAVVLAIVHDDVGPQVVTQTPTDQSDGVLLDTSIEVQFGEPLTGSGPDPRLVLLHNFNPVPGTSSLSGDSRVLSFVPDAPLAPNSVYELVFQDFTDEFGNPAGSETNACFVTTAEGFANVLQLDEQPEDLYESGDPPPDAGLRPVNLTEARFAADAGVFYGVVRFASNRAFAADDDNSGVVLLEIDEDQDPGTGFTSIKDVVFPADVFPDLVSGIKVEYLVGIEPNPNLGGAAYVGRYIAEGEFNVIEAFAPGICGRFYGFHSNELLPAMLDATFDYTLLAIADGSEGFYFDPAPQAGNYSLDLSGLPIPSPSAVRLLEGGRTFKHRTFTAVKRH